MMYDINTGKEMLSFFGHEASPPLPSSPRMQPNPFLCPSIPVYTSHIAECPIILLPPSFLCFPSPPAFGREGPEDVVYAVCLPPCAQAFASLRAPVPPSRPPSFAISIQDTVISACFSLDSKFLATTSRDNTMILWDAVIGQQVSVFDHEKVVLNAGRLGARGGGEDFAGISATHTAGGWLGGGESWPLHLPL